MKVVRYGLLLSAVALVGLLQAQTTSKSGADRESVKQKLIGAWRLVQIEALGPDGKPLAIPQPQGMLIYTADGHLSVQLMYPRSENALSNEYVQNGYEASFGTYDVDESTHTVTHHIQGSITRDLLVGKDLPRVYQFTPSGRLILKSARPDEHWMVTWEHH